MRLTIRKWDVFPDFYVIERADCDGRDWDGTGVKRSRLCGAAVLLCANPAPEGYSADIEGSARDMLDIATAIEGRREDGAKRCSVDARQEPVLFGSPRNDNGVRGEATFAEADDLAAQIRAMLGCL